MGVQPNQLNMTGGVTSPRGILSYEVVLEEARRPKTPRPTSARTRPSSASSISSMEDIKKKQQGAEERRKQREKSQLEALEERRKKAEEVRSKKGQRDEAC